MNAFLIPAAIFTVAVTTTFFFRFRDRKRAADTFDRLGLTEVADADAALARFDQIDRHRRFDSDLGGLVGKETTLFRRQTTTEIKPQRAWLAGDLEQPGVIGAFRAKIDERSRAFMEKSSSTSFGYDVVVVRLPFVVDDRLDLAPNYTGFDPTSFGGAYDLLEKVAPNMPRPISDDTFGHWYISASGETYSHAVRNDRRVRGLLWALRQKVAGAKDHIGETEKAELEAMFPGVPRTASMEKVLIDGDLLVLIKQGGTWSVGPSDQHLQMGWAAAHPHLTQTTEGV